LIHILCSCDNSHAARSGIEFGLYLWAHHETGLATVFAQLIDEARDNLCPITIEQRNMVRPPVALPLDNRQRGQKYHPHRPGIQQSSSVLFQPFPRRRTHLSGNEHRTAFLSLLLAGAGWIKASGRIVGVQEFDLHNQWRGRGDRPPPLRTFQHMVSFLSGRAPGCDRSGARDSRAQNDQATTALLQENSICSILMLSFWLESQALIACSNLARFAATKILHNMACSISFIK
jgi:hypothetical protein